MDRFGTAVQSQKEAADGEYVILDSDNKPVLNAEMELRQEGSPDTWMNDWEGSCLDGLADWIATTGTPNVKTVGSANVAKVRFTTDAGHFDVTVSS